MFEKMIKSLVDRDVQKVLRELDSQVLAKSLKGVDTEIQEIFFRNMSDRAITLIKEEMEYMGPIHQKDIEECQKQILDITNKLIEMGEVVPGEGSKKVSREVDYEKVIGISKDELIKLLSKKYDFSPESYKDIVRVCTILSELARKSGLLQLDDLIQYVEEDIFKKGLTYVIDGTDPEYINAMLNQYINTFIENSRKKLEMFADGLLSIQAGENPRILKEKLELHLGYEI